MLKIPFVIPSTHWSFWHLEEATLCRLADISFWRECKQAADQTFPFEWHSEKYYTECGCQNSGWFLDPRRDTASPTWRRTAERFGQSQYWWTWRSQVGWLTMLWKSDALCFPDAPGDSEGGNFVDLTSHFRRSWNFSSVLAHVVQTIARSLAKVFRFLLSFVPVTPASRSDGRSVGRSVRRSVHRSICLLVCLFVRCAACRNYIDVMHCCTGVAGLLFCCCTRNNRAPE